ncbi:hypothetical protein [Micromonospora chersina]|uniref:hypothetical protein n=1 Tax=Micromonospora chersina TaxID=47854 RepID=UPI003718B417
MDTELREVRPQWLTWPAGAIAALAWVLGRLTHVSFFDLVVVAALSWLGGCLLTNYAVRFLLKNGQFSCETTEDQPEVDRLASFPLSPPPEN